MTNTPDGPRAPGWYEDPEQPGEERWWTGESWSGARRSTLLGSPRPTRPVYFRWWFIVLVLVLFLTAVVIALLAVVVSDVSDVASSTSARVEDTAEVQPSSTDAPDVATSTLGPTSTATGDVPITAPPLSTTSTVASSTTFEPPATTVAAAGSEPSRVVCEDSVGDDLLVDGEPDTSASFPGLDLVKVEVDVRDDLIAVTWTVDGDVPWSLVSSSGLGLSWVYIVFLGSDPEVDEYSLEVNLIGDEWYVSVFDWVDHFNTEVRSPPIVEGDTIIATFPREAIERATTTWWAATEGDGDRDSDFPDLELFTIVQDVCPDAESIFIDNDRLPLDLG